MTHSVKKNIVFLCLMLTVSISCNSVPNEPYPGASLPPIASPGQPNPSASPTAGSGASPPPTPQVSGQASPAPTSTPVPLPELENSQIDRGGLALISPLLLGKNGFTQSADITEAGAQAAQNKYNQGKPENDRDSYQKAFAETILKAFNRSQADADKVAAGMTPNVLVIDTTEATTYAKRNGRLLTDDALDLTLQQLTGLEGATDKINANDKPFTNTFPYLAVPF